MSQHPQLRTFLPGEDHLFRQRIAEARALLTGVDRQLAEIVQDKAFAAETPVEVRATIETAAKTISQAIRLLREPAREKPLTSPDSPTHQQGQFLAFIREYIMRHQAGLGPSHAELQRFFDLTRRP